MFLQLKNKPNVFQNAAKHNIFHGHDKIKKAPDFKAGEMVRYSFVGSQVEFMDRRKKEQFNLGEESSDYEEMESMSPTYLAQK